MFTGITAEDIAFYLILLLYIMGMASVGASQYFGMRGLKGLGYLIRLAALAGLGSLYYLGYFPSVFPEFSLEFSWARALAIIPTVLILFWMPFQYVLLYPIGFLFAVIKAFVRSEETAVVLQFLTSAVFTMLISVLTFVATCGIFYLFGYQGLLKESVQPLWLALALILLFWEPQTKMARVGVQDLL